MKRFWRFIFKRNPDDMEKIKEGKTYLWIREVLVFVYGLGRDDIPGERVPKSELLSIYHHAGARWLDRSFLTCSIILTLHPLSRKNTITVFNLRRSNAPQFLFLLFSVIYYDIEFFL